MEVLSIDLTILTRTLLESGCNIQSENPGTKMAPEKVPCIKSNAVETKF